MRFVGYVRVSSKKQGASGLGIDAQKKMIKEYAGKHGELMEIYEDISSGGKNSREGVIEALKKAKKEKATLLIARLDRFSRRVSFVSWVMEQGVELCVVEMPFATTFQLHIHAAVSEEERRLAGERTKAALAVAKAKGVELGKMGKVRAKENAYNAKIFAEYILEDIRIDKRVGVNYSALARRLNNEGVKSFRGKKFYPSTVRNMIGYLEEVS